MSKSKRPEKKQRAKVNGADANAKSRLKASLLKMLPDGVQPILLEDLKEKLRAHIKSMPGCAAVTDIDVEITHRGAPNWKISGAKGTANEGLTRFVIEIMNAEARGVCHPSFPYIVMPAGFFAS